jgi:hypothetical protein
MAVFVRLGGVLIRANRYDEVTQALANARLGYTIARGGTLSDETGQSIYFSQVVFQHYDAMKQAQDIIDGMGAGTSA